MKFRYARHTNNLKPLEEFYVDIIGLEKLGDFENHSNYNGIFLGKPDSDWHLEFTESKEKANHQPDEDDLIVFYVDSLNELNTVKERALKNGFSLAKSKNPYWQVNGIELRDPDSFGVIITVKK